jgi:ubiquinone/menaquinone biosynthesis C-methylase UbiE
MAIKPYLRKAKPYLRGVYRVATKHRRAQQGEAQALEIYNDAAFAELLENWGNDTVWQEVQVLLGGRHGKVLDLACGTGRAHDFLKRMSGLEYHGCDISEFLIGKAIERGIPRERLLVGDATRLTYEDNAFDYVFSIGSLEHFTVEGIGQTLRECERVCRGFTFHQIPVSRSYMDEGWIVDGQSFWSNSKGWWMDQFKAVFGDNVWTMTSGWNNPTMLGLWFITADKQALVSA